jgi:hypothetical protein
MALVEIDALAFKELNPSVSALYTEPTSILAIGDILTSPVLLLKIE